MQINLHEPFFDSTDEEFVLQTLRSSWVSTGGPFVDRFEKEFASFTGFKHAISVCNGTIALELMLDTLARTLGVSAPFDVLVPTLSFIATANSVVHAGGRPIFVDCEENSLNLSANQIKKMILDNYVLDTRSGMWKSKLSGNPILCIMPAHLMGYTTNLGRLHELNVELKIPILEDAAEALGCINTSTGKHVGYTGLAAGFSFNGNKILTTGGGGMIVTNDDKFAARLKHLSTTAKTDGLRFLHDEVGYNYRLVNILAALGCSQLTKLPERLERKKRIFELYKQAFLGSEEVQLHEEAGTISNHWLVNLRFRSLAKRETVLLYLNSKGIQARPLWELNHRQLAYKSFSQPSNSFEMAQRIWETTLSVPSSPQLDDLTIKSICSEILGALN